MNRILQYAYKNADAHGSVRVKKYIYVVNVIPMRIIINKYIRELCKKGTFNHCEILTSWSSISEFTDES